MNEAQRKDLFYLLNNEVCPKHVNSNLSYCLQKKEKCDVSFYLASWLYNKIKKKYHRDTLHDILSKEIHNGLEETPYDTFKKGYNHKGSDSPKITILEYGDLECLHCQKTSILLDIMLKKYPNEIKIIFKHFPISFHKNAKVLAMISEALGSNKRFWQFQSATTSMNNYDIESMSNFINKNNIDIKKWRLRSFDKRIYCKITNSANEARMLMLSGVPTLFFNNKKYNLTQDLFSLEIRLHIEKVI